MRKGLIQFAAIFALAGLAGCSGGSDAHANAERCEVVLASFEAVPIARQTPKEALELIETIRIEQEAEFGAECESVPGWRRRFAEAHARAVAEVERSADVAAESVIDVQETEKPELN